LPGCVWRLCCKKMVRVKKAAISQGSGRGLSL
jgi:hypothetical protein